MVAITGTNLAGAMAVKFGATVVTTFTSDTANQIVLNTPAGSARTVAVTVVAPGGTSATSTADQFSYVFNAIGLYNPTTSMFYLNNSNTSGNASLVFMYGPSNSGLKPVVGNWAISGTVLPAANQVAASASVPALTRPQLQPKVGGAGPTILSGNPLVVGFQPLQPGTVALPGSCPVQSGNLIPINSDAAGHNGSTDSTLASNEESPSSGDALPLSAIEPQALDQINLATVVDHELGNVAGLHDLDTLANDVTSGLSGTGVSRNGAYSDVVLAD
jgi:hypothetical protein